MGASPALMAGGEARDPPPGAAPFVGRSREVGLLLRALEETSRGHGSTWVVAGPGGIGKTRLLGEVAKQARQGGFEPRWGYCIKGAEAPFFPFEQIVRGLQGPDRTTPGRGRKPEPDPDPAPEGLPYLAAGPARASPSEGLPVQPTTPARMLAYLSLLERASEEHPLLLLVDDLQWADALSVSAFQFLARNLRHLPAMLVASYRDEEVEVPRRDGADLEETLRRLVQEGGVRRVDLRGLPATEATELLEGLVGSALPAEEKGRVYPFLLSRMEGNPYLLVEATELLSPGDPATGKGPAVSFPELSRDLRLGRGEVSDRASNAVDLLQRMASRRLGLLPPAQRELLEFAAVAGLRFEAEPLVGVVARSREQVLLDLARLADRHHLLRRIQDSPPAFAFDHPMFWEATLSGQDRSGLRSRALALAHWTASHRTGDPDRVVRLFHDAGEGREGLPWMRQALERAVRAHAFETVERLLRWIREVPPTTPAEAEDRAREEVRVAGTMFEEGSHSVPGRILESLPPQGLPLPLVWEARLLLCEVIIGTSGQDWHVRLREILDELAALGDRLPPSVHSAARVTEVRAAYRNGDWGEGVREGTAVLDDPAQVLSPSDRSRLLYYVGWCRLGQGKPDEARPLFQRGLEVATEHRLRARREMNLNGLGAVEFLRGNVRRALELYLELTDRERGYGDPIGSATHLLNLAEIRMTLGQFDEAQEVLDEAAHLADRLDLLRIQAHVDYLQGELWSRRGRFEDALESYEDSLRSCRAAYVNVEIANVDIARGMALFESRRTDDARSALEGMSKEELAHISDDQRPRYHILRAWVRADGGDAKGSSRELAQALRIAEASRNPLAVARVREAQAGLEAERGDLAAAERTWRKAEKFYAASGAVPVQGPPRGVTSRLPTASAALPATGAGRKAPETGHVAATSLPLSSQIVLHLVSQGSLRPDDIAPLAFTQEGIAHALQRGQNVFAKSLQRLEASGMLASEVRHVQGEPRRRKVYLLTSKGEALGRDLRLHPH